MTLLKKALASMSILAIAMTAFTAISVSAADKPVIYPAVTVNEAAKTATVEVYAEGLPTTTDDEYHDQTYVAALALQIDVSSYSNTDISTLGRNFSKWSEAHYTGFDSTVAAASASNANKGYLGVGGSYSSGSAMKASAATKVTEGKFLLCTIKDIDLSDAALENGFTVDIAHEGGNFANILLSNEYFGGEYEYQMPYKQGNGTDTLTVNSGSWAPSKPDPTPTTPEYVYNGKDTNWGAATFVGDYSTADDKAIAVKAEVKPGQKVVDGALVDNTYTGLVWKAVKADGTAVGYEQDGLSITGNGTYVFGLAIDGVSEAEVQTNGFGIAVK